MAGRCKTKNTKRIFVKLWIPYLIKNSTKTTFQMLMMSAGCLKKAGTCPVYHFHAVMFTALFHELLFSNSWYVFWELRRLTVECFPILAWHGFQQFGASFVTFYLKAPHFEGVRGQPCRPTTVAHRHATESCCCNVIKTLLNKTASWQPNFTAHFIS